MDQNQERALRDEGANYMLQAVRRNVDLPKAAYEAIQADYEGKADKAALEARIDAVVTKLNNEVRGWAEPRKPIRFTYPDYGNGISWMSASHHIHRRDLNRFLDSAEVQLNVLVERLSVLDELVRDMPIIETRVRLDWAPEYRAYSLEIEAQVVPARQPA